MLRNPIVKDQHIAPLPLMQHPRLVRHAQQHIEVPIRDLRAIAVLRRHNGLRAIRVRLSHALRMHGRQAREERRIARARLRADGRQDVLHGDAAVGVPGPGGELGVAVEAADLGFDFVALGLLAVAVEDLAAEGLVDGAVAFVLPRRLVDDGVEDSLLG